LRFGGIDVGSLTAQAVILENGEIEKGETNKYRSIGVKTNPVESAKTVMGGLLDDLGIRLGEVDFIVSTGYGREQVEKEGLSQANISEISCHGIGARWLLPQVRTVIDIGGQDAKVICMDSKGELADFVMNDKCAAGTGRFLEVMCRTLEISLDELGPLAKKGKNPVPLSSRCSIFCKTDVIHHLQRGVSKEDLAASVNIAMAERVALLARRVKMQPEVTMSGGVAKNSAVRAELERMLGVRMLLMPTDPQIVGALGAAILASRMGGGA